MIRENALQSPVVNTVLHILNLSWCLK